MHIDNVKTIDDLKQLLITTDFVKIETKVLKKETPQSLKISKMGGIPYWPKNIPLVQLDEQPGKLMAQLNFDEISKIYNIPDFPTTGILQFYCPYNDDMWGLRFDGEKSESVVVYHENTSEESLSDEELIQISTDMEMMPSSDILSFKFQKDMEYLTFTDEYQATKNYDFNMDSLDEDLVDEIYENLNNSGSKVGGFAYFTQSNPRYEDEYLKDDWILLFQLDTDDNLMWGDAGVANWFIKRSDLKNKDFSNVLFNWDCC